MNRVSTLIIGALFAVAAVEFGLLGASAAGLTGGDGGGLPPVGDRVGVDATSTATATFTATPDPPLTPTDPESPPQLSPPSVDATGIDIRANPLTIECDGSDRSVVTVQLFDANGDPVPDGTWVYFSPYNGYANPWSAQTSNGYAKTMVSFYGDLFPYGPNLIVESGLLQAGIRIRCNPQSNPCPETWPESPPVSGPCAESTPYPCNPSPGSGPLSPPCAEPTPYPCNPSPGSDPLSPPCEPEPPCSVSPPSVSPPCEEPPQSPPTAFELRLDCDTDTAGIQTYCLASPSADKDVAVVITNQSGSDAEIAAFNFVLNNADISIIEPLPGVDTSPPNRNNNPDFNDAEISATGWECGPVSPDRTPGGPSSESLLSCFNSQGDSVSVADGASLVLGVVHYGAGAQPGSTTIFIDFAAFYDPSLLELGSCNPLIDIEMNCHGAVVEVPSSSPPVGTPTPAGAGFEMAVDCEPAVPGIQNACPVEQGDEVEAAIVVKNGTSADEKIAAVGFSLINDNLGVLVPNASDGDPPSGRDGNPDFNDAGLTSLNWLCAPPTPSPDVTPGGTTSESFIGCFNGYPLTAEPIAAGESIVVATVRYTATAAGTAQLAIRKGNLYDENFSELGLCRSIYETMTCKDASITIANGGPIGPPATPTNIATNTPASTNTPVPTSTAPPTATTVPTQTPAPPTQTPAPPTSTSTPPARTSTAVPRTATAEPTRTPASGNRCADVNDDGRVTRADIREILRRVHDGPYIAKYDINRNGKLGASDVVAAIRQLGRHC